MCPESVSLGHLVLVCHCSVININTVQSQTHSLTGLKGAVKKARESKLLTAVCAAQAEQPQKGLRGSLCTRQGGGRREGLRGLFLHMEGLPGWVWVHSHSLGVNPEYKGYWHDLNTSCPVVLLESRSDSVCGFIWLVVMNGCPHQTLCSAFSRVQVLVRSRGSWHVVMWPLWPVLLFQNYTQYIPLSIYDLQTWMGSPSIFVYDCSNAGLIVKSFKQFALQREQELEVRYSKASVVSACMHTRVHACTRLSLCGKGSAVRLGSWVFVW